MKGLSIKINRPNSVNDGVQPLPSGGQGLLGVGDVSSEYFQKTVASPDVTYAAREQYRHLAAVLYEAQAARQVRTIVVTSAVAMEGKTLTATNLAITLAESFEQRVLLIDADFRRPSIHKIFNLSPLVGLSELFRTNGTVKPSPVAVSSHLFVLTAGTPTPDPMVGLSSDAMRILLAEAAVHYDWVIIDTPPVGLMSDARLLVPHADGVLLVVASGRTPYDLVQRAADAVGRDNVLGVVLNRAEDRAIVGGTYYSYDYYQSYGEPQRGR